MFSRKPDTEKFFDDMARVAGGAAGLAADISRQVREEMRTRFDDMATRMDLVPREDFERLEAMLTEARLKQEDLEKRLAKLEGAAKPKAKPKTTREKPAAKKKTPAKKTAAKAKK